MVRPDTEDIIIATTSQVPSIWGPAETTYLLRVVAQSGNVVLRNSYIMMVDTARSGAAGIQDRIITCDRQIPYILPNTLHYPTLTYLQPMLTIIPLLYPTLPLPLPYPLPYPTFPYPILIYPSLHPTLPISIPYLTLPYHTLSNSLNHKGKQKSPGRATSRSRSQPLIPGGREKVTQINVCIANKQMHGKHKDQLTLPQAR